MNSHNKATKDKNHADRLVIMLEALACGFWALIAWMEVSDGLYESSKEVFKSILSSL